jgi:sugar fermentation stimulation protein A
MSFDRFLLQIVNNLLYTFPPLQAGVLLRRYQRFFAEIQLTDGAIITAHCANTGPMLGLAQPGVEVMISASDNPKRKLAYTWELVKIEQTWVGVNTSLPNRVVAIGLHQRLWPELEPYDRVQKEVKYGVDGRSRIDFLLTGAAKPLYLEVKNTTWKVGDVVRFPDTVSTRGQKHLQEAINLLPEARSATLYFINRADVLLFGPGAAGDPKYAQLLGRAMAAGMMVIPARFRVTPAGVTYEGLAEFVS